MTRRAGWVELGSALIGDLTVTHAAAPGKQHQIQSITCGYNRTASGLLLITDGTNILWGTYIHNTFDKDFTLAIRAPVGSPIAVQMCSGGILVKARISVIGDTL